MKNKFIIKTKKVSIVSILYGLMTLVLIQTKAQWSELGGTDSSTFNWYIERLTTDANGNVYAAGHFTNGRFYNYVAKWNGSSWQELGETNSSTFNDAIACLTTDLVGNVYAAGGFTNGINIHSGKYYVAKWNGSSWQELGGTNSSTFNDAIACLTTDLVGNVYAAGGFTNGNGKYYVAKWNGSSWQELGGNNSSKFNDAIFCLTTDAVGNVYAAGGFTKSNGKYYVAKWNGSSWQELGGNNSSTFNDHINCITTDAGGNVYATGWFTNDSGKSYVAKWNGRSWQEFGSSNISTFNDYVYSLTTDANGNVYAAGWFTNGINYTSGKQYVAKWSGSSWQELGGTNNSTFNSAIRSLTTDAGGNVYAAGWFTNDSGKYYVAKYVNNPLPVTLSSFTAQTTKTNTITTTWQTATDLNTTNFIVQHSTDGSSFSDIGTVNGIGSGANGYSFTDNNPANGVNYYRLKLMDKDGSSSYSKIVSVSITNYELPITVSPNPAKDFATISFSKAVDKATIAIYDITGKAVISQMIGGDTNTYKLNTQYLKSGVYVLKVKLGAESYTEKLLINK